LEGSWIATADADSGEEKIIPTANKVNIPNAVVVVFVDGFDICTIVYIFVFICDVTR